MRSKPGILIVTHHRVGNAQATRFDRAIFSASADSFDEQLKYFKHHLNVIDGEELQEPGPALRSPILPPSPSYSRPTAKPQS
jgi:hypothetical protein